MKIKLTLLIIGSLLTTACNKNKIGDTIVDYSIENSEISIDKYPHGKTGIEGFNTVTYPEGFSIQKIDEEIYDIIKSKDFKNADVGIKYRFIGKDQYGKDTLGKWINIGLVDATESKKYADFHSWNRIYGFLNLMNKNQVVKVKEDTLTVIEPENPSNEDNINTNKEAYTKAELPKTYGGENFEPAKGVNTIYNQSNENLIKLNWRVLEDVFFKDLLDVHERYDDKTTVYERVYFKGEIVDIHWEVFTDGDAIDISDEEFGKIRISFHSLFSKKTIIRPEITMGVGDEIEGWGAKVTFKGKDYYYLNQAVLR